MKQFLISLTGILLMANTSKAQTAEDSVKAVINQLFDAMRTVDGAKLKDAFADSAVLQTIRRTKEGAFFVEDEKVQDFVNSISTAKKDSLDERITYDMIKIDGPLASVWTPYKFYYAGKFSHCGVNSFQVVRINSRWKIQYLVDTRRRQGCD